MMERGDELRTNNFNLHCRNKSDFGILGIHRCNQYDMGTLKMKLRFIHSRISSGSPWQGLRKQLLTIGTSNISTTTFHETFRRATSWNALQILIIAFWHAHQAQIVVTKNNSPLFIKNGLSVWQSVAYGQLGSTNADRDDAASLKSVQSIGTSLILYDEMCWQPLSKIFMGI